MCVAGRVLSPGPRTDDVTTEGSDETVQKTSFYVRADDRLVLVEAWRDTAGYAQEVKEGGFYFIEGIKRKEKRQDNGVWSILRYQKIQGTPPAKALCYKCFRTQPLMDGKVRPQFHQCFQVLRV